MKFEARRFSSRARGKCETIVVFGAVQARNAGHWSLFEKCRREMRDCRDFLVVQARNAETVVHFRVVHARNARHSLFCGVVQARIAGHWSLLHSCRREMRDCRDFLVVQARKREPVVVFMSRARAKCETFVIFGIVQARSARLSSFLQGCGRDPRIVGGFLSSQ